MPLRHIRRGGGLRGRLTVGQGPLEALMNVRFVPPQHSLLLELEFKNSLFYTKIPLIKGMDRTFIAKRAIFC